MGAQIGVMRGDSYCCWTGFENVSNHQGVICTLPPIKAGKQWTAKHPLLQGKCAEVLKKPQHYEASRAFPSCQEKFNCL